MTIYEITEDLRQIQELFENAIDENGNPRELTSEEEETLKQWFTDSKDSFSEKFDSYGKLISNLKASAEVCEAERKAYKDELDRLSKRSKVYTNRVEAIKKNLHYVMDVLNLPKIKTDLYSATIQATPLKIDSENIILSGIPEEFLKPRELDTSAVKQAVKSGRLEVHGGLILDSKTGDVWEGITAEKGTTLVIR